MSWGFMTTTELRTCRVPEDPASLVPVGGYVVAYVAFYERGINMPSH
jgi:hypothetical protein